MKVYIDANPGDAPCCIKIVAEDGRDILIQTDYDYPGVASNLGFVPCECGFTDGTVDCKHKTASEMIAAASEFISDHDGESFEDPGYFDEDPGYFD